ncbi:MAG: response regulator [Deltaproteobacteria bacterium]|uniref:response regulator n=1 Tax=Desulfobacula sp. TaxID=2593537 RepID=UPI0019C9A563|nr:response regulator [Candidatus Desulfobacula maris]MBL6993105.1 response regulator [Desulfobacula sp.]
MKWWNKISYRLTAFILLLAVVPLAGFGISTIRDIQQTRLLSVEQIHDNIARHSVDLIESSLLDTQKKIQLVIDSNELQSADSEDQEWILQILIKSLPHLYSLTIASTDGQERVKVGRDTVYNPKDLELHTDHPDFLKMENPKTIIGSIHESSSTRLILDMYIPLLSPMDRQVTAVLAAEIDIEKLLNFTADLRVGTTGYVYIVNEKGKILVHPDNSVVLAGEYALYNPLVQDFVSGHTEFAANKTYVNRKQTAVLTNVRAATEPKLMVVVIQSKQEALAAVTRISKRQTSILVSVLVLAILLSLYFTLKITRSLGRLSSGVQQIGAGNLNHRIKVSSSDELGIVTRSFNRMADDLKSVKRMADEQGWMKQGSAELDNLLRGDLPLDKICTTILTFMARFLKEQVGLIYVHDGQGLYTYIAGYAFQPGKKFQKSFKRGEGLIGQAVQEKKMLTITDIPNDYISVTSGLGALVPANLSIVPFVFNDQVEAVMELGSLAALTQLQNRFLSETADSIAIIIAGARSRQELSTALVQTRQQADVLQKQQEELQSANEELEEQTQLLMSSESRLKEQQEELQAANEELEEKTEYLERNKKNNVPSGLKKMDTAARKPEPPKERRALLKNTLADDRDKTGPGDKVILIIEDDVDFAMTLLKFCREKGFKGLVALTGEEGLELAQKYPSKAIILDIHLPGIDGWTVLDSLKENSATRHIPVHFMSSDDPVPEAFTKGAMGYITKPVSLEALEGVITHLESIINKEMKDLLLVEDNLNQRHAISKLISGNDVAIHEVSNGKDAILALEKKPYDCMILDLGLPDMSGFDLLKKMEKNDLIAAPPVIVYTGRELTQDEEQELRKYSETIIIKGVRSEERLLDETSLFLHRVVERMPEEKRKMISDLHDLDRVFQDRTILIVDDDMRNVFALSKVLHAKGINTIKAENGLKALEILEIRNDVDLVLMDIMMPVMDGYETMKKIRAKSRFDKLPIIALTAKAMQRDKEDCIAAGANDYLVKPLEIDRLLSMMRVWLYR